MLSANPNPPKAALAPRAATKKDKELHAASVRYAFSVNDCWRPSPTEMTKPDYFALADAVSFWKRGSFRSGSNIGSSRFARPFHARVRKCEHL